MNVLINLIVIACVIIIGDQGHGYLWEGREEGVNEMENRGSSGGLFCYLISMLVTCECALSEKSLKDLRVVLF